MGHDGADGHDGRGTALCGEHALRDEKKNRVSASQDQARDGDHSVGLTNTSSSREQLSLLYAGMW